jgi:hypothetical protein
VTAWRPGNYIDCGCFLETVYLGIQYPPPEGELKGEEEKKMNLSGSLSYIKYIELGLELPKSHEIPFQVFLVK